jgi:putative SOS response-associated peptidase YedK
MGPGALLVEQATQGMGLATFNARVETVTTKPFFREPFKKKRCLMPVSGYYE